MLQPVPSFLDVSRSFAGRMRDETDGCVGGEYPRPVSILGRGGEGEHRGSPNAADQSVCVDARHWGSVEITARDSFEGGAVVFGIAVWRTAPRVIRSLLGCMAHSLA
jgi:hypothetical protein